jgi:hypothetical protein
MNLKMKKKMKKNGGGGGKKEIGNRVNYTKLCFVFSLLLIDYQM